MTTAATAASPRSTAAALDINDAGLGNPARQSFSLHRNYFADILPTPPIVCGRPLLPLSIGRYRLMHRFNVAFVADGTAEASAGDLLLGVAICSMRCDDFLTFISSPNARRKLEKWARLWGFFRPGIFQWPIIGWLLTKLWGETLDQVDACKLLREIEKFQEYIRAGAQPPRYWDETNGGGPPTGSHWSQNIESSLREHQGWTREEINEEPLNKALWDYFKHCENQGLVRLMSEAEAAELDKPEDPAETEAWLEWARVVELAKAGKLEVPATPDSGLRTQD